jgi:hypothetical protein
MQPATHCTAIADCHPANIATDDHAQPDEHTDTDIHADADHYSITHANPHPDPPADDRGHASA